MLYKKKLNSNGTILHHQKLSLNCNKKKTLRKNEFTSRLLVLKNIGEKTVVLDRTTTSTTCKNKKYRLIT